VFFDDPRRKRILRAVFDAYYARVPGDSVVFDTSRSWNAKAALLGQLYPDCRIVCCVREVGWILDSIERMLSKKPLEMSRIFQLQRGDASQEATRFTHGWIL
jgi:sulfotransferase